MTTSAISSAIDEMRVLEFKYKGSWRSVEPHALGYNEKQKLTLCAWQFSGGSGVGFRDFYVELVDDLIVTDETFEEARAGYNPNDKTLTNIISQI